MNLSFRNRIALHYMIATAIIVAVVFSVVFFVVQETVYHNLDNDLTYEAEKHTDEIKILGDSIQFINKAEWEEIEHREIQVNPVFIQIFDKNGNLMDKSPNLKGDELPFRKQEQFGGHFNENLNKKPIRQIQIPIEQNGKIKGYVVAAMSLESSNMVFLKLKNVLIISYLLLLAGLYFISRFLAGRSIVPIRNIIETTNRITKNNLNERVNLPDHKDELFDLSSSINELLQRIENAIEKERQFTSDASHELRTPLSSLRGTLEVLIRKPREQFEYEEKIKYSLSEIDRMTTIIEQLLLLARLDSNSNTNNLVSNAIIYESLPILIDEILSRYKNEISAKNLTLGLQMEITKDALIQKYYANLILDNIIGNAIKYSTKKSNLQITVSDDETGIICEIKDDGIGIKKEDIDKLFNPFYRSDALNHREIFGNGLGLSIAKKAADAINAKLFVEGELGVGTTVTIVF
ncbi:MAG: HAMP domain-containing sensor histidine kinase [Lutibacter sp.]|nr:HAMP domain-containing sensor histidine kinase [Lutibacter sp.]MDT8417867.1 HAMP domain-containing sensor histidine kinase [Lutibacter sp.]